MYGRYVFIYFFFFWLRSCAIYTEKFSTCVKSSCEYKQPQNRYKGAPLQVVNELLDGTKFGVRNNIVLLLYGSITISFSLMCINRPMNIL